MSSAHVICLSSDDEAPLPPVTFNSSILGVPTAGAANYTYPSDGAIPQLEDSWPEPGPKRRRLSPTSEKDDFSTSGNVVSNGRLPPRLKKTDDRAVCEETDPILFTSSAPSVFRDAGEFGEAYASSDDSLPDDILAATSRQGRSADLSNRTAALLASLTESKPPNKPAKPRRRPINGKAVDHKSCSAAVNPDSSDLESASQQQSRGTQKRTSKLTEEEKASRAQQREKEKIAKAEGREKAKAQTKEKKAKEKEEDNERKRLQKIETAKEKRIAAELAEVNKAKLDKKDSTPEMIVDLPASIDSQSVHTQTQEFLKALSVDFTMYQSSIPNVIKWRRKMKARWNAEQDHWEPLTHMEIENEKHIMCLMPAKDFVSLAMIQQEDHGIETHVAKVKSVYNGCVPIYLIEGLQKWLRKNRTAENRAYQAKVLAQDDRASGSQRTKRKNPALEVVDEDMIEDALLRLQVMNGCLVHHTSTSVDTAEWIANFTQHISTIPYRMQRMNLETSFCMESGQVKTGEDKDDTFVKMLQEVVRVTPPIAFGIASEYSSVIALVQAFRRHGPLILEDLQKSANRNGAVTDRKIGPAISRRLYKVFMESDPASTDV